MQPPNKIFLSPDHKGSHPENSGHPFPDPHPADSSHSTRIRGGIKGSHRRNCRQKTCKIKELCQICSHVPHQITATSHTPVADLAHALQSVSAGEPPRRHQPHLPLGFSRRQDLPSSLASLDSRSNVAVFHQLTPQLMIPCPGPVMIPQRRYALYQTREVCHEFH